MSKQTPPETVQKSLRDILSSIRGKMSFSSYWESDFNPGNWLFRFVATLHESEWIVVVVAGTAYLDLEDAANNQLDLLLFVNGSRVSTDRSNEYLASVGLGELEWRDHEDGYEQYETLQQLERSWERSVD